MAEIGVTMAARGFASDNHSGAHPDVLAAMAAVNDGHVPAYGDDAHTARGIAALRAHLGGDAEVFFVFNGTGANVTGLGCVLAPWQSVICPDTAHIACDEAGAPERFTGAKLVTVPTPDGKLTPALVKPHLKDFGVEHHSQPAVISVTQVTEMGTVYEPDEIRSLAELAHRHGMLVHMDGARIANAAVALGAPLASFTTDVGVDVLSFGGTKNGMVFGEAVCFLGPEAGRRARDFRFVRKQAAQLASKTRFIGAQFAAMYEDDLWSRCAAQANDMTARLLAAVRDIPAITVTQSARANEIFAVMPADAIPPMQEAYPFYIWNEPASEVRWVTSWDTTPEDVDTFATLLRKTVEG